MEPIQREFPLTALEKDVEMRIDATLQEYNFDDESQFDIEGKIDMTVYELIMYIDKALHKLHKIAKSASRLGLELNKQNISKYGPLSTFNEGLSNKQFEVFWGFWYIYAKMMRNVKNSDIYNDAILVLDDGNKSSFFCFPLNIQQFEGDNKLRYDFLFLHNQCFPTIYCHTYVFFFWKRVRQMVINHFAEKGSLFSEIYGPLVAAELMLFLKTTDLFLNDMHTNFITRKLWTQKFLIGYGNTLKCEKDIVSVLSIFCQWLGSYHCKEGINMIEITKMSTCFESIQFSLKKIKESDFDSTYRKFVEVKNKQKEEERQEQLRLAAIKEEKEKKKRFAREKKSTNEAQIEYYSSDETQSEHSGIDDMDEVQRSSPTILRKGQQKPPLKK